MPSHSLSPVGLISFLSPFKSNLKPYQSAQKSFFFFSLSEKGISLQAQVDLMCRPSYDQETQNSTGYTSLGATYQPPGCASLLLKKERKK